MLVAGGGLATRVKCRQEFGNSGEIRHTLQLAMTQLETQIQSTAQINQRLAQTKPKIRSPPNQQNKTCACYYFIKYANLTRV
jgi:hypothetical protein